MGLYDLESETHLSPCHRNVFAVISLFVIILSIYSNTFHATWHFDDEQNIVNRKAIHLSKITWGEIKKTVYKENGKLYRPVACLSLALNYYFGKDNVVGYHLVNILIHFVSSIFLLLFIYDTLKLPNVAARYGPNAYFIALLATALWASNPIQTQAVTYIVQRMASMGGMFYIMSMFFFLRGRISNNLLPKLVYYSACLVSALLAFGSKENTAMLPISIFLFDLFLFRGLRKENIRRNSLIFLAATVVPACIALLLMGPSLFSVKYLDSQYHLRSYTLLERLLTEPRILLFYISLIFYPMPDRLCITHDFPISHNLFDPPTAIFAILAILGILGMAVAKSKKYPLISYCIIFFFLNHVIESTVFGLELVFEHRNYIPSMLLFVPVIILIAHGIQFFSYKKSMQALICLFVILVLVGQGHSAFIRNFIWKTEESLWLDAVDKSPNLPRVHHNLGRYYGNTGQREKAIVQYEEALRLKRGPHSETHHLTHFNLALIYINTHEEDKAIEHLQKAIEIVPYYADAYNNLAIITAKRGRYDDAYNLLIRSLTYDRNSSQAHNNLGYVLLKTNRTEEAIIEFKKALHLEDNNMTALHNLGIAHKYLCHLDEAARCFKTVLRTDPKALFTRLHLAETYWLMGKKELAKRTVSATLDLIPPEAVYPKTKVFFQEDSFEELPDSSIILPLLRDAYLKRCVSLEKMAKGLGEGTEKD